MIKKFKDGVYLAEIKKVEGVTTRVGHEYYKISLEISNQNVQNEKVNINIFEKSYCLSIDDFIGFIGTCYEKDMLGKLFYCNIKTNPKGYPELKEFYMTVDSSKLFYDPRVKRTSTKRFEQEISVKGLI